MKKKNLFFSAIVLTVFLFSIINAAAESNVVDSMLFQGEGVELTFEKAVAAALEGNPAVRAAQKNLEQAEISYKKGKSEIDKMEKYFDKMDIDPLSNAVHMPSPVYKRDVTLPLLNLDYSVENAHRELDATIAGVKAAIEQTYFSLLQASRQCEIQKENLDISADLYEKLKKKYSLGLIARQELLNGEINLLRSQTSYKAALNTYTKTKMALNNVLGHEIMNEIILKDELAYKEFKLDSIAHAINQALAGRKEIKMLEYMYNLESLNLDITLLQYPEITYVYQEQKIKKESAQQDLENAKKNIEMEIRNNYLDIMQKQDEIKSGEKSIEQAEEMFKLSQVTYDAGLGLQTDIQQAQMALQQAKLGLSQAILDYNLAVSKFNDSIGVGRKQVQ